MRRRFGSEQAIALRRAAIHRAQVRLVRLTRESLPHNPDPGKIEALRTYIAEREQEISVLRETPSGRFLPALLVALLLVGVLGGLLALDGGITGLITYSLTETGTLDLTGTYTADATLPLSSDALRGIMVSGSHTGAGEARLFLETSRGRLLIHSVSGERFAAVCGAACSISAPGPYALAVEIDGGELSLEEISYLRSELGEFVLVDSEHVHDATTGRYVAGEITVANPRRVDLRVTFYAEGELAPSLTLERSEAILTDADDLVAVPYALDVPADLPPGRHEARVVVRLLPEGPFTGQAPSETYRILVDVPGERFAPGRVLWVVVVLGVLAVMGLGMFFLLSAETL